jgi:hypothetical protein
MHGIFIFEPHNGLYYIAARSARGRQKFIWSSMPVQPTAARQRAR